MSITVDELFAMNPETYQIVDIRGEQEVARGAIDGALHLDKDEISASPEVDKTKKLVICCSRGETSVGVAEKLCEEGFDAVSLQGGYTSWLLARFRQMEEQDAAVDKAKEVERSLHKKFRKNIWSKFTKAVTQYELVKPGDKIAVCISGGKDSMLMAKLFQELQSHGRQNFEVVYLVMNPGYNQLNAQAVLDNARLLGIPIEVFHTEIFDIVANQGGSPCYLCARMRRGYLYSKARELGCNKIALGHHYDDVIETILMGMLYGSQIQTMMPKLHSTNFPGMELIRPLYLIREKDILRWRDYNDLHFIQCACRLTESCASCGGTEKGSKRAEIKRLIHNLSKEDPQIPARIFRSVENVNLDTVIAYKQGGTVHRFLDSYDE